MRRKLVPLGLVVLTVMLAGCIAGPSGPGSGCCPDYSGWGWASAAFGAALAAMVLVLLLIFALMAIVIIALVLLAVLDPGPIGQAAAVVLLVVGVLLAVAAIPGGGAGGLLLGIALAAVGGAALQRGAGRPAARAGARTVVLGEKP